MVKKKEEGIEMLMTPPASLTVPSSFKIGDATVNKELLEQRIAEDTKHTITGVNDTSGYKSAIAFRASYRTTRTTLAKVVKEMSQPHKDYVAALKKASDDIGAIAFKGEQYFDELITAIDDEKERIKQEAILAEQRKIQGRVNQINGLGAKFDGETYYFLYTEDCTLTVSDIKDLTDSYWETYMADLTELHKAEEKRLADEKLRLEEEAEEKRKSNLLITQQAEQNKQDALALTEKRTKLRIKELKLMQFEETVMGDGDNLFEHPHSDRFFCLRDIETLNDNDWEKRIEYHEAKIMETRNVIVAKSIDEEEDFVSIQELVNEVIVTEPIPDYQEVFSHAEELAKENPSVVTEVETVPDYSLNEFEKWVGENFSVKPRETILKAINMFKIK